MVWTSKLDLGQRCTRIPRIQDRQPTVLKVKLDSWAIGWFAHPQIEIFAFAGFEKEHIITVVQFGKLVKLI